MPIHGTAFRAGSDIRTWRWGVVTSDRDAASPQGVAVVQ